MINQYRIIRCDGSTLSPATSPSGCIPIWSNSTNQNSQGGVQYSQYTTVGSCLNGCMALTSCVGADFSIGDSGCYLHLSLTNFDNTNSNSPGVNQYRLVSRCQACMPSWQNFTDQNSAGGELFSQYNTVTGCLNGCASYGSCVGVDFNTQTNQCYYHNSAANWGNTFTGRTGINQYRLVPCEGTTLVPPSGSQPACLVSWLNYTNQNSQGGAQYTQYTTINSCLNGCVSLTSCVGVDFSFADNGCFLHMSSSNFDNTNQNVAGVNQYRLVSRCQACTPTWQNFTNQNSAGGQLFSQYNTVSGCLNGCASYSPCVGIDFNTQSGQCYYHNSASDWSSTSTNVQFVNQYRIIRCDGTTVTPVFTPTSGCTATWSNFTNQNSNGGQSFTQYTMLSSCLNGCVQIASCVGLDYAVGSNGCFLHMSASNFDSTNTNVAGVNQYRLVARCQTCTVSWQNFTNQNSGNGQFAAQHNTVDACLSGCAATSNCVGVDFNMQSNLCYYHNSISDWSNTFTNVNGINQYRIIRCDGTTTISSAVTSSGCIASWSNFTNTNAPGAALFQQYTTVSSCLMGCINLVTCVGADFDFNVSPNQCWIHTSSSDFNSANFASSVNQYRIVSRCGEGTTLVTGLTTSDCTVAWTNVSNTNAAGATQYQQYTTVNACLNGCVSLINCFGADFDTNFSPNQCWIHTSATNFNNAKPANGVTQYRILSRCASKDTTVSIASTGTTTDCTVSWLNVTDVNSGGATQYQQYTTVNACLNGCVSLINCVGADFDTNFSPNQCWIHTSASNFNSVNAATGVTQYRILSRCANKETTISASTAGTTSDCTVSWSNVTDTNSVGATQYQQYTTVNTCLNGCVSLINCVGVDFDRNFSPNQCWIHTSETSFNNAKAANGVTQYRILSRCANKDTTLSQSSAATTSDCIVSWTNFTNMNAGGATLFSQYTTVTSCLNGCVALASCVGVDFDVNSSPNQCWVHTSASDFNSRKPANLVNQYVIVSRCANKEILTTTIGSTSNCIPFWQNFTRQNSPGAVQFTNITSSQACADTCISVPTCLAIDVDLNFFPVACFIHTNATLLQIKNVNMANINQYILVDRCSSGCTPSFVEYNERNSVGAVQNVDYNTTESCRNACISLISGCVAVDITTVSGSVVQCWVHLDEVNLQNKFFASNTIQYVLQKC